MAVYTLFSSYHKHLYSSMKMSPPPSVMSPFPSFRILGKRKEPVSRFFSKSMLHFFLLTIRDFFFRNYLIHGSLHGRNNPRLPDVPVEPFRKASHYPQTDSHFFPPFPLPYPQTPHTKAMGIHSLECPQLYFITNYYFSITASSAVYASREPAFTWMHA